MANLGYKPIPHDHQAFLARASKRKGFAEAYEALDWSTNLPVKCSRLARVQVSPKMPSRSAWALPKALFPGLSLLAKSTPLPLLHFSGTPKRWAATCRSSWCRRGDAW
jgi:hypothetical protein